MYGKYLPKKPRDMHFDVLFDYQGRAEAVRKAQQGLDDLFDEGRRTGQAEYPRHPDFVAAHMEIIKILRTALANAYPPGFWEDFERLRNRNTTGLPIAIEFLEADPWFFRTGYVKERLIRYIIRLNLTANYSMRLRKVVLAAVDKRYRREFREYCHLARKVDNPELWDELRERLKHDNPDIRRRAQWVLDGLDKGVNRKGRRRAWGISRNRQFLSSGFLCGVENLRLGQPGFLEETMRILEEKRLWMFGYDARIRGKLIQALADTDLPIDYRPRLQSIILSVVDTWYVYG